MVIIRIISIFNPIVPNSKPITAGKDMIKQEMAVKL
jgi:hypothetical protein